MLSTFDPWAATLTWFVTLNWTLTLGTSAALIFVYFRQRYMLVKPSIQLIYFSHVILQWPLALYSGYYEKWLPNPYGIVALVHGFCICGLTGSLLFFRQAPMAVWRELRQQNVEGSVGREDRIQNRHIAIAGLSCICALLATVYFSYVPLQCTGIYGILVTPDNYFVAREISYKLLADPSPRYALSILMTAAAPLMTGVISAEMVDRRFEPTWSRVVVIVLLLSTWSLASLNGGKANLVYLALVIIAASIWRQQLRVSVVKLTWMVGLALLPALLLLTLTVVSPWKGQVHDLTPCFDRIALTVASPSDIIPSSAGLKPPPSAQIELDQLLVKEHAQQAADPVDPGATKEYIVRVDDMLSVAQLVVKDYFPVVLDQVGSILYRSVVVPFEVGGWYVHYMETRGPMGLGAIPRLATPLGIDVVNPGNKIALTYGPEYYGHPVALTMNAGAGFIFSMFLYFGYWALALNLVLLWLLDLAVAVYLRIDKALIIPMLAASTLSVLKFIESDYGASWLTHGFGCILILGIVLSLLIRLLRERRTVIDA